MTAPTQAGAALAEAPPSWSREAARGGAAVREFRLTEWAERTRERRAEVHLDLLCLGGMLEGAGENASAGRAYLAAREMEAGRFSDASLEGVENWLGELAGDDCPETERGRDLAAGCEREAGDG